MMSDERLKPCPFCGGELRRNTLGNWEDTNRKCIMFGIEIPNRFIPAWNTRKPMERIVERLEGCVCISRDLIDGLDDGYRYGQVGAYRHAIEIVKGGGVNEVS